MSRTGNPDPAVQPALRRLSDTEPVRESIRAGARAAAVPIAGLALTYMFCVLTPWGRRLELLSADGRLGTSRSIRAVDLGLLDPISTATVLLALATLVVVGLLNGRWRPALRSTVAVLGAVVSAEALKHLLPGPQWWSGQGHAFGPGSFPSGHTVIVTSISLAVLSISSHRWRRRLVGPLVAGTAIAATATVTVGWHRPGDVVGSFFLVTAWHQALSARQPADRRLRSMLPRPAAGPGAPVGPAAGLAATVRSIASWRPAAGWWVLASLGVLGAALEGVLTRHPGRLAPLAYLLSLVVLLAGALITVATSARLRPAPVPVTTRRHLFVEPLDR